LTAFLDGVCLALHSALVIHKIDGTKSQFRLRSMFPKFPREGVCQKLDREEKEIGAEL